MITKKNKDAAESEDRLIVEFGNGSVRMGSVKYNDYAYLGLKEEIKHRRIGEKEPTIYKGIDDLLKKCPVVLKFKNKESVEAVIKELEELIEFAFED